jgi:hypothetical protein
MIQEKVPLFKQARWNVQNTCGGKPLPETEPKQRIGLPKIMKFYSQISSKIFCEKVIVIPNEDQKEETSCTSDESKTIVQFEKLNIQPKPTTSKNEDLAGFLYIKKESNRLERYWCRLINKDIYCISFHV